MKTNENATVAKGAEVWHAKQVAEKQAEEQRKIAQEDRRLSQELMEPFDHSFYKLVKSYSEEEPYYPYCLVNIDEYHVELPPEELVRKIMARGRHDEIMKMLERYTEKEPYSHRPLHHCDVRGSVSVPLYLQDYVAKRSNLEEVQICCQKYGFGAVGQDNLLETGNHNVLMWYLEHHGLLLEQQRKLIARGNTDEIRTHILHHALAPELFDELIADMKAGNAANFYKYIAIRDVPDTHQKALLEVMTHQQFCDYIERHGFWESALPDLVKMRTDDELALYITKHHFLGEGVYELVKRSKKLIQQYMQERPDLNWIYILSSVKKLDYELLTPLFLKVPNNSRPTDEEKALIELLRNGSHEEVMTYLKEKEPWSIYSNKQATAELFFRNNAEEFEYYLDNGPFKNSPRK